MVTDYKKGMSEKDVLIKPLNKWEDLYSNEFTILNNGDIEGISMPNRYLHGTTKKEIKHDHIFHVDYPKAGKFIIHIGTVSQGARLKVRLDDKNVADKIFPAGPGKGRWKKSLHIKKHDIYQCLYDARFAIKVPKGKHTITFSNAGKDWLSIEDIILTNYLLDSEIAVRCLGLKVGKDILLWVQNKEYNWKSVAEKKLIKPVENIKLKINGIKSASYSIEWWDTIKGEKIKTESKEVKSEVLELRPPMFNWDIACRIKLKKKFDKGFD